VGDRPGGLVDFSLSNLQIRKEFFSLSAGSLSQPLNLLSRSGTRSYAHTHMCLSMAPEPPGCGTSAPQLVAPEPVRFWHLVWHLVWHLISHLPWHLVWHLIWHLGLDRRWHPCYNNRYWFCCIISGAYLPTSSSNSCLNPMFMSSLKRNNVSIYPLIPKQYLTNT